MMLSRSQKSGLLFVIPLLFALHTQAQIEWGVRSGLNVTEFLAPYGENIYVGGNPQVVRNFPRVTLNAGVLLSVPLSKKFTFQPEVQFSEQGASGKPFGEYIVSSTEIYKYNYLNVPLVLQYNLPMGFYVETGPQVGLLISAEIDQTVVGAAATSYYNVQGKNKSTDVSWALGGGFMSPINLGFDIRYNLGLTNINNASLSDEQAAPIPTGSVRNGVLQISVFYLFGKPRVVPGGDKIE